MRVILADSNEIVRIGLRTLLATDKNIQIVGEAKSDEELIALNRSFDASVILIDFTSKGFTIDVIAKLLKKKPATNIVAITPEQSAQTLVNALRLGVKSYVKKDCDAQEIIDAVKETCVGRKFFCGQILETIRDVGTFIRTDNGFRITAPEGFVAVDRIKGNAMKLIDRLEFSQANFTAAKNWSK